MRRSIISAVLIILVGYCCQGQQTSMLWERADQAFNKFDLPTSSAILRDILRSPVADGHDSAKVYRLLAQRDWQFHLNYTLAKKHIDSALAASADDHASYVANCEIATAAGRYATALQAGEAAISHAMSATTWQDAAIAYAQAVYQSSLRRPKPDTLLLHKAGSLLTQVLQQMPGHPQAAKQLLGIGLLSRDGMQVMNGWNAYFHFPTADSAWTYLKTAALMLSAVLPQWKGRPLLSTEREQVAQALALSGFHAYAALLASPSQRDITRYARFLQRTETLTARYYRQLATGVANDSLYEQQLLQGCQRLLQDLHISAGKQPLTYDSFLEAMRPRFGTMGFLGVSSSFHAKEICLGHIVNITHKEVMQYGYKGALTFIEIDLMSSNGYISWFTNQKRRNGGWSVNDTIYQVREAYIRDPMEAWTMVTDSSVRREKTALFEKVINDSTVHDTTTILNGMNAQLRQQALDSLYVTLYRRGLRGNQLQLTFMNTFEQKQQDASIFAHEGRHSIDQIHFAKDFESAPSSEREYRAKLSEIACADFSAYLLGKMVSSIGPSGHGIANRMILKDMLAWMDRRQQEIRGYDSSKPAIKQLHLLSDSQIRSCFQEADPLAKQ
jgi:hypothetical protein